MMIRFIVFSFILTTFLGCKTSVSDPSSFISGNSKDRKDYLLVFRGSDWNGALNKNFSRSYIKSFFNYPSWPFFMNYNVYPPIGKDPNQGYEEIVGNEKKEGMIQKIAAKLSSDSTFILFINAHGGRDGTATTGTKDLKAKDVIQALKDGLNKNPLTKVFKRFIIISDTCHSGEFIGQFQANKDTRNGSLFKEGIYIYSSDAEEESYAVRTIELFIPMLSFLRELQVRRCQNKDDYIPVFPSLGGLTVRKEDYQKIYKSVMDDITKVRMKDIHTIRGETGEVVISKIKDLFGNNIITFHTSPTFTDLVTIIEKINNNASMNIEFSDEYQLKYTGVTRIKHIFPDLDPEYCM